ncbi:MAG TPA: hypothetical protein VK369_09370 [Segetibacter sp.]|nr:hypothetical protein [Segetibacter sp.]
MITKILITLISFCVLVGCSKDKYTAKPQLKYKSVNTKVLNRNETLTFVLEVTDAEGDIQDSIWVQEVPRNCSGGFTSKYKMPDFTAVKNLKGEINICYSYGVNLGCPTITSTCQNQNDSATFKFWIQDKAKNISDTISSEEVVIIK